MERLSIRILARIMVLIMILGGASIAFAGGTAEGSSAGDFVWTYVLVNGQTVTFSRPRQIIEGTLLAQINPIAELMGAETRWNAETQTATIIYGNTGVAVGIENKTMTVRNMTTGVERPVVLPVPARFANGVEYYPIEAIVKELGATVAWENNTLYITTPGTGPGAATAATPPPQTTPSQTTPSQAPPSQTTPSQTTPPQTPPSQTPPSQTTPRPAQPSPTTVAQRYYRSEAARRNVMSPSVFALIGYDDWDDWVSAILFPLLSTKLAGTVQGGKFGLNVELFDMSYSFIPYWAVGMGAGMGVTFKGGGLNWLGVKPYTGFTVPVWVENERNLRIFGDVFSEIGYSKWGSLLTKKTEPGFGLNPGFELGVQFGDMATGGSFSKWAIEGSYGITFYSDKRLKHNIGLAGRFKPEWW